MTPKLPWKVANLVLLDAREAELARPEAGPPPAPAFGQAQSNLEFIVSRAHGEIAEEPPGFPLPWQSSGQWILASDGTKVAAARNADIADLIARLVNS